MLVLTRRIGEKIVVGEKVTIEVLSVGRGKTKLGIEAPPHIAIHRQETQEQINLHQRKEAHSQRLHPASIFRRERSRHVGSVAEKA